MITNKRGQRIVEKIDGHDFELENESYDDVFLCKNCGIIVVNFTDSPIYRDGLYYLKNDKFILCSENKVLNMIR